MKITRQKVRAQVLNQAKQIRTCSLAQHLCLLVRRNTAVLEPKDVEGICTFISSLCKEHNCHEPAELCQKAAHAVIKDEKVYLELCGMSCQRCREQARRVTQKPQPQKPSMQNIYVA